MIPPRPFLFFFLITPKIWVGRTTLNGEKKEDGLMHRCIFRAEIQYFDTAFFLKISPPDVMAM